MAPLPSGLARTRYKNLAPCFLIRKYQRDGARERIRPIVMSCKRIVDQLLHELGIVLVPAIEKSELPVGIVGLNRLYACELRRGMPDEFVGHGDLGRLLPFAQHELEATGLAIRFSFVERIRLDADLLVIEEPLQLDELVNELQVRRS